MEPSRQRLSVLLVVGPPLRERVAQPEHRAAEDLALQAAGVQHRADVADRGVVEHLHRPDLGIDFHEREADDGGP